MSVARIGPPQPTEDYYPRFPSNYLGLEWTQTKNVKQLAYGLRINSTLAMLAYKGLVVHHASAPRDPKGLPGETPLTEITAPRIAEYRLMRLTTTSAWTGRVIEPSSVNRELSILRGLLRMAADDECDYLEQVPKVKMLKEPQGRLRFLSEPEASRLLEECRRAGHHPVSSCRSPDLYAVVVVALNTGMRRGEVLGLEWSRVDLSRGVLQLEETKSGTRREIPMNRAVYDVLAALPRSGGARLFPRSVRGAFLSAVERAKIPNFHFHDLRHTFASWLTMRGRPLKEVQELLGHKSIRMTERYSHLAPERLRDAVAMLEDFSTTSAHEAPAETREPVSARQN